MATRPTKAAADPARKTAAKPTRPAVPSRAAGRALEGLTEQMETLTAGLDALTRRFDEFSRQVLDELRAGRDGLGPGDGSGERGRGRAGREIDPGDAVPPGVAPLTPAPLTEEDRKVLDKLEHDLSSNT